MTELEKILKEVNDRIEKPLVDARFGDNWREHQKRMLAEGQINTDMLFDIAWKQGRRAILLERVIEAYINKK